MSENKIKYGICNLHYAKITSVSTTGEFTYASPKAFAGAVSLSLSNNGDNVKFYADNIEYWVGNGSTGYEGELEVARVTDDFKKDILGYVADNKDVLVEDLNAEIAHFALLCQFEGDVKATRHVLYNVTAGRPNMDGSTKGESIEPATETISISATSAYNAAFDKQLVKAEANANSNSTTYDNWFTAVYAVTPKTS